MNINREIEIAAGQNIKEYEYWLEKLAGGPVKSCFPYDYKEYGDMGTGMALNAFRFDDELSGKSVKLTRGSHHTLHIVMAAALTALLWRYTANKDIMIGTPIYRQKTAETGGEYINTMLPLRNLLSPEMSFKDLLGQVRQTVLEAVEHQAYPVELLPEKLNMPFSGEDGFPLFDVVLLVREIHDPGDPRLRSLNPNIIFSFSMGRGYVEGEVEYNRGRYRQETIDRITGHLVRFLSQAISHINRELVQIDILSEAEKRQLLEDFNDTGTQYPRDKTIHQLFEEQVEITPDVVALAHMTYKTYMSYMTYDQLNRKSIQLAGLLQERGVAPGDIVGIVSERSLEMIVGVLGILKVGGAYLPIDPEYPEERKRYMLTDSNARVLVSELRELSEVSRDIEVIDLSQITKQAPPTQHTHPTHPTQLSYVIYTSGSTGRPKGVMVEHRNVVRLVKNTDYLDFEESLRILQTGALEFDASTFEIWGALLNGGRLYLVEKDKILVPEALKAVVRCYNITTMWLTAPLFNQLLDADVGIFHGLRHLLVGGDVLSVPHINRVRKAYPQLKVINGYGPTENTTFSTTFHLDGDYGDRVPIGRPIANSTAYILNKYHYPVPMGVAGELWVGGDGVARGYLNNPELTAERFGPCGAPSLSAPLYHTGDLARWLPDGTIDFLGRMDHQVKIRGFRIELGEIEHCLLKHETVKEAVVTAGEGQTGDKYLCAYIVLKENAEHKEIVPELRLYLSNALPDYMIPSYFVSLDNIPLTANGKVDRKRLPAPETGTTVSYTAPRDEVEKKLTTIWSLVLGIPEEKIGIDDNFFDLGGHSLKSMVMLSKIHREFNVKLSLNDIFKFLVIRKLSPLIKQQGRDEFFSIEAVEKKEYYKLSPPQKRFYILGQVERESINYNIWSCFRLAEGTGLIRLESAFKHLIRRHESFRTCFIMVNDRPVQRIHDEVEFKIEYCDSIDNFIRPFDLSSAPLLRAGVITGDILVVDMHHIVSDGISMEIFQKELIRLYSSGELPPLRIQYKDYTEWQVKENRQREEELKGREAYWLKVFESDLPVLDLPLDYPRPPVRDFEGKTIPFRLEAEQVEALELLAKEEGGTLFMILLAVFYVLLAKLSPREEIVVGTPIAGRSHPDLENIIGVFINTLALKNRPSGVNSFNAFLGEVKEGALAAFENQEFPFEELVERLPVSRDAGRNPLFDVMFALQNMDREVEDNPGLEITPYDEYEYGISKFDLTLFAQRSEETLCFHLQYSTALFKEETVKRFARYFKGIVSRIIESPGVNISQIEILSPDEKREILEGFNDTATQYPRDKTIQQLFEEQVSRTPDAVALAHMTNKTYMSYMTYNQLSQKSDQLAGLLQERGVVSGDIVGIMSERSIEMIVGVLAILKAGGAYLPIDPDYPRDRKRYMLTDSNVKVLVSELRELSELSRDIEVIDLAEITKQAPPTQHTQPTQPTQLSYVIYTSGSTGRPRGVMVEHRNVVRLVKNSNYIDFGEGLHILQTGALEFDASTFEIWGTLLNGGRLYLVHKEDILATETLKRVIRQFGITTMWLTAPLFNRLVDEDVEIFNGLCHLLVGGDVLSPPHISRVRKTHPGLKIINGYGPTENTTFSTTFHIDRDYEDRVPIGSPIANSTAYIFDKYGYPVPVGVCGELSVGGEGVARGYLNNPELTAERFSPGGAPSLSTPLYHTGDLARWLDDGNIEFLGRMDQQVKIRGFRIELGEIEHCLLKHETVKQAVVTAGEGQNRDNGGRYLCAYVVLEEGARREELIVSELRRYLSGALPDYMLPSYFVKLEKIPLTPNGKLDRKMLPSPEPGTGTGVKYIAPRDEMERKLAAIWSGVLGIEEEKIGIDDNFFALGGHSLKGMVMASKIHREMNVKIMLSDLFKTPYISALSQVIKGAVTEKFVSLEVVEKKEFYELSSAQKRLFFIQYSKSESTVYNMPVIVILEGQTDAGKVENAFRELIRRHESLRTSFEIVDGRPVQKIHDPVPFKIEYHITGGTLPPVSGFIRPFRLSAAPLLRVGLLKIREEEHLLIVDMHHIVSDGLSHHILMREFPALYRGKTLPPLKFQYKDYSRWQNSYAFSGGLKKQEDYWLKKLAGPLPQTGLRTDFPRTANKGDNGRVAECDIPSRDAEPLRRLVKKHGVTMYMVICALFNILLFKLVGRGDIFIGTPVAGRSHPDLENIIGMFVNTVVIRSCPAGHKSFREFLMEVKKNVLEAFDNQDYQFEGLVEKVVVKRDPGRNPLFDVLFMFASREAAQPLFTPDGPESGTGFEEAGLKIKPYDIEGTNAKFDMLFTGKDTGDSLCFNIEYSTELFKEETIERYMKYFKEIVSAVNESETVELQKITISHDLSSAASDLYRSVQNDFEF